MLSSKGGFGRLWVNIFLAKGKNIASGASSPVLFLNTLNTLILRRRCIYRKAPVNQGDNVYQPESFPPAPESDTVESTLQIPGLRDEDQEEVSSESLIEDSHLLPQSNSSILF